MTLLSANWYNIFYWLTVSDGVKKFFDGASNLFTTVAVIGFILLVIASIGKAITLSCNSIETKEEELKDSDVRGWEAFRKYVAKVFWPMLVLSVVTWIGYVATPSKKDCMFIVAGGAVGNFLGSDSAAKAIPSDIAQFLHTSLQEKTKGLISDAKKEISEDTTVATPPPMSPKKRSLLDKAKSLTKDELVDLIKEDTTFAK